MCSNIVISDNIFKCAGFPAIGHHGDCGHHNILIEKNIFDGSSGNREKSRGHIIFRSSVFDVKIRDNIFILPEDSDALSYGIVFENPNGEKLLTKNNIFKGAFDAEIIIGEGE